MARQYIPLKDRNSNHSHQIPDDGPASNSLSALEATHNAPLFAFTKQTLVLLCKTLIRCLATAIFIAFVLVTLKIYQNKGNFTSQEKTNFNVIITALSLCLGLNFFDSFKDLANVLRWRIRARYRHSAPNNSARERLILGIESLINVARLGWESRSIPWLWFFCITWIFLNLLAQTSVALINLTYNLNDGTNWNDTYTRGGIVNASNLACYVEGNLCSSPEEASQGRAHAYGLTPSVSSRGVYDQIEDVYKSRYNYGWYCRRTLGQCAYRFVEYNPNDQQKTYPILTDRIITASAGQCLTYWETENPTPAKDTSGLSDAFNFRISNGSVNDSIIIPRQSGLEGATTYIYRDVHPPKKATTFSCGDRCIWMWAHKNEGKGEKSTFYQCPITISDVKNSTKSTHIVPDDVAKLAASAIALQGRWAKDPVSKKVIWTQFQFYPYGNAWELHYHNESVAGANMAEFAIRSLSTMADRNPSIQASGLVPYLGISLKVYWEYAVPLFSCIVAVQLALSILVYVLDDEPAEGSREI